MARLRPHSLPAGLFLAGLLISGFTMLRGIDPFDEGLMLQAARRVADGQMPYADFLWSYGPAHPYLLGGLIELHGVSLLDWRILRVLADAGVALVVFLLVRREAGTGPAAAGWLAAVCAMAQPRSANPFPFALLFALLAVYVATSGARDGTRVLGAAALTALAAAWRLDFGIYAGLAVLVALTLDGELRRSTYAAAAAGLTLLVYLPFLIADGPADLYDALIGTSLREKEWWTLPFPWEYDGGFGSPGDLDDLLEFYVPALLLAGLAVAALAIALRRLRIPPAWGGLAALAAGGLAYLLSRTDEFHVTPLLVVLAALLPLVYAAAPRPVAYAAAGVLGLLVLNGVSDRLTALVRPPELERLNLDVADGVRAEPGHARELERLVPAVRAKVPPDEPIYVAPLRSDLVAFNNPLFYVLAERDNPSDRDFGLLAKPDVQRDEIAALERARPRVVIRWLDPISARREPNERGRSSGDRSLEEYIRVHYIPLETGQRYELLTLPP